MAQSGPGHFPPGQFSPGHFPRTIPPDNSPSQLGQFSPVPLKTQLENCIYTYMYAYIYTYMHIHIDVCTHVYTHTIHTCIHTYIHAYIYTYIQSYILTYFGILIHIGIHTYIHSRLAYIHTDVYVCISITTTPPRGLGGVVVIDAAIGAHGRGSRLVHYLTVAATLDKSLTSHCL